MTADEQRRAENFAISCPLEHIEDTDMLAFLATLIHDNDHLREKLETEPDYRKKSEKLDAMRPHLRFRALPLSAYVAATAAKQCGVQPIFAETEAIDKARILMPKSEIHQVQN